MRVLFLVDYRGKLTKENYYTAGTVAEFEPATAQALIDEGRAVRVALPKPLEVAPASPARPARRQRERNGGVL